MKRHYFNKNIVKSMALTLHGSGQLRVKAIFCSYVER